MIGPGPHVFCHTGQYSFITQNHKMPGKTRTVARFPNRRGMDWEPGEEEGIQHRECVIVMLRAWRGNVSLESTERDESYTAHNSFGCGPARSHKLA